MVDSPRVYDAVVVGGGLVGATVALRLRRQGRSVALLDHSRPRCVTGRLGYDTRTVALTQLSLDLMAVDVNTTPITRMQVWEEQGTTSINFDANLVGERALAFVAEVSSTNSALWAACEDTGVDLIEANVSEILDNDPAMTLVADGCKFSARLVIAADGVDSTVCRLAGVAVKSRASTDAAVATVVRTEGAPGNTAFQRFGSQGPLAFLPLGHSLSCTHCSAVIWSQDIAVTESVVALDDSAFINVLQDASEGVLGRIHEVDRRFAFLLNDHVVDDFNPFPRLLVIGDAARAIHPLAGQGVNLGLEDVAGIIEKSSETSDLGEPEIWRTFAQQRRVRAQTMISSMRFLRGTYGLANPIGRWLRNVGISMVDRTPVLKKQLIREAMGLGFLARPTI